MAVSLVTGALKQGFVFRTEARRGKPEQSRERGRNRWSGTPEDGWRRGDKRKHLHWLIVNRVFSAGYRATRWKTSSRRGRKESVEALAQRAWEREAEPFQELLCKGQASRTRRRLQGGACLEIRHSEKVQVCSVGGQV